VKLFGFWLDFNDIASVQRGPSLFSGFSDAYIEYASGHLAVD